MGDIDFSRGGYGGGADEEFFKFFTIPNMEYWWHFREVLIANQHVNNNWKLADGSVLSDEHQMELIALSLLNYAVHTSITESFSFYDDLRLELNRIGAPFRFFEVRKLWKASYSSLYTSFNALANIVCILVGNRSAFGDDPNYPRNYTPQTALNLCKDNNIKILYEPLQRCKNRLVIRDHLDHYWAIWTSINYGEFLMDDNFKKGYIALRPDQDARPTVDATARLHSDVFGIANDFNIIYRELAITNGFLDQYLSTKGWIIDYANYYLPGEPHNGKRPQP